MKTLVGIAELKAPNIEKGVGFEFKIFEADDWDLENFQDELPKIVTNKPIGTVYHMGDGPEGHAEAILQHLVQGYFGCRIRCLDQKYMTGYQGGTQELQTNTIAVAVKRRDDVAIRGSQPAADFYDMLRKLDEALQEISGHIRGINDPNVLDARLKQLKASADAMRCYIDIGNEDGPEAIPRATVEELNHNLQKTDLSKLSNDLRGWAKVALDYLKLFLKDGGS